MSCGWCKVDCCFVNSSVLNLSLGFSRLTTRPRISQTWLDIDREAGGEQTLVQQISRPLASCGLVGCVHLANWAWHERDIQSLGFSAVIRPLTGPAFLLAVWSASSHLGATLSWAGGLTWLLTEGDSG